MEVRTSSPAGIAYPPLGMHSLPFHPNSRPLWSMQKHQGDLTPPLSLPMRNFQSAPNNNNNTSQMGLPFNPTGLMMQQQQSGFQGCFPGFQQGASAWQSVHRGPQQMFDPMQQPLPSLQLWQQQQQVGMPFRPTTLFSAASQFPAGNNTGKHMGSSFFSSNNNNSRFAMPVPKSSNAFDATYALLKAAMMQQSGAAETPIEKAAPQERKRVATEDAPSRKRSKSGKPRRRRNSISEDEEVMPGSPGQHSHSPWRSDRPRRQMLPRDDSADESSLADSTSSSSFGDYNGEQRLLIDFESLGVVPESPERLGKKGVVPDGVAGSFMMYSERWFFSARYASPPSQRSCVEWSVRNEAWEAPHVLQETVDDAVRRNLRGVTLCNRVFTEALERRAGEIEAQLAEERARGAEADPFQVAFLESRMNSMRPKRFSEGPLLFGLRHRAVQRRHRADSCE